MKNLPTISTIITGNHHKEFDPYLFALSILEHYLEKRVAINKLLEAKLESINVRFSHLLYDNGYLNPKYLENECRKYYIELLSIHDSVLIVNFNIFKSTSELNYNEIKRIVDKSKRIS